MAVDREAPGLDGPATDALLRLGRFFARGEVSEDRRAVIRKGGRDGDVFYRDRWSYDKVVRSTHGVNCTGSCSWKVYVKDGIITWETQQTDYPSTGPDSPEYEPRGCPRGASFSWYTYSPSRVRYPYLRGALLEIWREARGVGGDHGRPAAGRQVQGRAREGRAGALVLAGGDRADRRRARAHDRRIRAGPGGGILADPGDVAGLVLGRQQVPVDDRRDDPVVLRLVRGHADRLTTGFRRPDRRARVRRLVELLLPDHLGHQPADHPDPGRALHDRGPLPGTEGRRRLARLLRPHQVRRRLAGGGAGHRRGAGHGDGARGPVRVLPGPAGAVLHRLREDLHRRALPGDAARARRRLCPRPLPDRGRPRRARRGRGAQAGHAQRGNGGTVRPGRLPRIPFCRIRSRPLEP